MTSAEQVPAWPEEPTWAKGHAPVPDVATMAEMRAAFLDFFDCNYHPVVRFVMLNGATLHDAQDAAGAAFLDAWERLTRPNGWETIQDPPAWIRTVALRKYRRPTRSSLRVSPVEDIPDAPQPAAPDHGELTTQAQYVLATLRHLDEQTREVMAFHLDGFSSPQIAVHLGITDQKVRDLLRKARKILGRKLGELDQKEGGTR